MIPILYKTIIEGALPSDVGQVLVDCLGYTVEENRNGEYELTLDYPANGEHAADIEALAFIYAKPNFTDDPQLFEIYKVSKVMSGRFTVNARHVSYLLSNKVITSGTANSCAAACALLESSAGDFTITTDKLTVGAFNVYEPSSVRSWFGGKAGSLLDIYGAAEWHYDNFDAELLQNRGQNRGVKLLYGKNLTQLSREINIENLATAIWPYCKDEDGNVTTGAKITTGLIVNTPREIAVDLTDEVDFESATPILSQLATAGAAYIANNNFTDPTDSITLDFVQLGDLAERVDLCDTVTIEFAALGISATAKCIKTVWNGLEDRYESCTFGNPRVSIADTITAQQKDIDEIKGADYVGESELQTAINTATAKITGNSGGYVINGHDTNADGLPDENLIMDTNDIATATKVIRSNLGGIGFSTSGYAGPYTTAIGFSGIVADAITTGTLNANLIKAGVLQSLNGKSQIDMTSGVANLYQLTAREIFQLIDENNIIRSRLTFSVAGGSTLEHLDSQGNPSAIFYSNPTHGGGVELYDLNNKNSVNIYARNGINGGAVDVLSTSGVVTGRLFSDDTNGGQLRLTNPNNVTTFNIWANNSDGYGAQVWLNNSAAYTVVRARAAEHGGALAVFNNSNKLCISLFIGTSEQGEIYMGDGTNDKIFLHGGNGNITCVSLTQTSSRKVKENIKPIDDAKKILELDAVSFDFKNKANGTDKRGFIAEDVAKILPNLVTPETDTTPASLDYVGIIPYLQAVIKDQEKRISALEEIIKGAK